MRSSSRDRLLEVIRQVGVLRPRDLQAHGIPREHLRVLVDRGDIQRVARGVYILSDADVTGDHGLAEACKRVPRGVVCLLSSLRYHGMTTQAPFEVWLAIQRGSWRPRLQYPPLRVVWFSGQAMAYGVQEHRIEAVPVRIYSAAKTVADCFKYRNKIGLDVAMEALRDCWGERLATADELWEAAKVCRVANVMRPYMESLV